MAGFLKEETHQTDFHPERFPMTATDKFVSAFFSIGADIMLQVEMKFSHRLDPKRLRQALQLALDAEPVLGCSVVFDPRRPYWKRLPPDERDNFRVLETASEFDRYKAASIDPSREPAVKGALFSGEEEDILLLKIAHEAADAGGAKDIAYLVASIYTRLKDDPEFKPEPNLSGTRGMGQIMKRIPWWAFPRIMGNYLAETLSLAWPKKSHVPAMEIGTRDERYYVERHIPSERVRRIAQFGKPHDAKLNDMIMAAFFRALARTGWDGRATIRSGMTVDMRHWYMPNGRAEAVCNLSGLEICKLGKDPGKDFTDTLHRVVAFTQRRKKNWFGLNYYVGPLMLASFLDFSKLKNFCSQKIKKDIASKALIPLFTNLGPIDENRLVFDKNPNEAWVIVPTGYPPFFGAGMSGYMGSLTLSTGAVPTSKPTIEAVFNLMLKELP